MAAFPVPTISEVVLLAFVPVSRDKDVIVSALVIVIVCGIVLVSIPVIAVDDEVIVVPVLKFEIVAVEICASVGALTVEMVGP